jgi:hypothetical protein
VPKQQQQEVLANLAGLAAGLDAAAAPAAHIGMPQMRLESPTAQLMQLEEASRAGSEPVPDLVLAGGNSWYGSTAASCRASQLNITAVPAIADHASTSQQALQDEGSVVAADAQEAAALAAAELAAAIVAPPASSGANPLLVTLEAFAGIPGAAAGDGAVSGNAEAAEGPSNDARVLATAGSQRCSLGGSASSKALSSEAAARAVAAIFGSKFSKSGDAAEAEQQGSRSTGGGSWLSDENAGVPAAAVKPAVTDVMRVSLSRQAAAAAASSSGGGSWLSEDGEAAAGGRQEVAAGQLHGAASGNESSTDEAPSSAARVDSKPATPSEKARALARAALDALSPQLRKSREWKSGKYAATSGSSADGSSPSSSSSSSSSPSKKKGWKKGEGKGEKKAVAAAAFEKEGEAAADMHAAAAAAEAADAPVETAPVVETVCAATPSKEQGAIAEQCAPPASDAAAVAMPAATDASAEQPPVAAAASQLAAQSNAEESQVPKEPAAHAAGKQRGTPKPEPLHVSLDAIANSASVDAPAAAAGLAALHEVPAVEAEDSGSCRRYAEEADEAAAKILEQAVRSRATSLVGARASFNTRHTSSAGLAASRDGALCHLTGSSDMGSVDAEYAMASAEAAMAAAAAVAALPVGSRSRLASFGVSQDAIMSSVTSGGLLSTGSFSAVSNGSGGSGGIAGAATSISSGGANAGRISAGGNGSSSGDYRYSELIFRLQQFLPALKGADGCGPAGDFESTWELIKVCDEQGCMEGQQQQQQQRLLPELVSSGLASSPSTSPCHAESAEGLVHTQAAAGGSCGEPMSPSSVVMLIA